MRDVAKAIRCLGERVGHFFARSVRGHRPSYRAIGSYRSGRSPDWLKSKNPACAAVKREAEEDWGKERWR
jgi:hypothetical protein